jgi:toxin YoeB
VEVVYKEQAIDDIKFWKKSGQKIIQDRIVRLVEDIKLNPYSGLGKPEALKHELSGFWSREIDKGNRLIYKISGNQLHIISLRGHYLDK